MKDEIRELVADCDTYNQVAAIIDDWMDYYNKDRYHDVICKGRIYPSQITS